MERCGVEREKGDEECGMVEYGEGEERSMGKERWGGRGEEYGEGEVGRERRGVWERRGGEGEERSMGKERWGGEM